MFYTASEVRLLHRALTGKHAVRNRAMLALVLATGSSAARLRLLRIKDVIQNRRFPHRKVFASQFARKVSGRNVLPPYMPWLAIGRLLVLIERERGKLAPGDLLFPSPVNNSSPVGAGMFTRAFKDAELRSCIDRSRGAAKRRLTESGWSLVADE